MAKCKSTIPSGIIYGPHFVADSSFARRRCSHSRVGLLGVPLSSGYLLHVLERSFRIEEIVLRGASAPLFSSQARAVIGPQNKRGHTAIHLRCTVEQAAIIRKCAAKA